MGQVNNMPERVWQQTVVEYAEIMGWLVYHTFDSRKSNPGFPDLVLVRHGQLLFVELKRQDGKLSEPQLVWLEALQSCAATLDAVVKELGQAKGIDVDGGQLVLQVHVWRPDDWPQVQEVLRRG